MLIVRAHAEWHHKHAVMASCAVLHPLVSCRNFLSSVVSKQDRTIRGELCNSIEPCSIPPQLAEHRDTIRRRMGMQWRVTSDKVRRLFKRGFRRHSTAACMVLNPMESRHFAGPAAIITVDMII